MQDQNKIPRFLFFKRRNREFDVFKYLLFVYPRSDGIQYHSSEEEKNESRCELNDATLRLFRVFPAPGEGILDSGKNDHENADEPREVGCVPDERTEHARNGIEALSDGAFIQPFIHRIRAGRTNRSTIRPRNAFGNEHVRVFRFFLFFFLFRFRFSGFRFSGLRVSGFFRGGLRGGILRRFASAGYSAVSGKTVRFGGLFRRKLGSFFIEPRSVSHSFFREFLLALSRIFIRNVAGGFPFIRNYARFGIDPARRENH